MGLDTFLGADDASDSPATPAATEVVATGVKPAETAVADSATPATPAGQTIEKTDKPEGDEPKAETDDRTRDGKGRFTKQDAVDEVTGLKTALRQTRAEKQQLKRQLEEQGKETSKRSFFDDPDAALDERDQRLQTMVDSRFYDLCEEHAKTRHADFEQIVDPLIEACEEDRGLGQQVFAHIRSSKDPAEALFRFAVNRRELQSVGGDLGKYKDSIEAPLRLKIKDLESKLADATTKLGNLSRVPQSLNSQGSATPQQISDEEADREDSLDSIVEPRKKRRA